MSVPLKATPPSTTETSREEENVSPKRVLIPEATP